MKKKVTRIVSALLALVLITACLAACGAPEPVNTKTGSYEDMVAYLTAKGYISKNAKPVNMLETAGYLTDRSGGQFPYAAFADKAGDYDGLWLMWWDSAKPSAAYTDYFQNIGVNGNTIVVGGGAAILEVKAVSGNFAIAFAEGYAKTDDALKEFKALPKK